MLEDFFRNRLDPMIEPGHPLAVLGSRLPWDRMQARLAPQFAHKERLLQQSEEKADLAGCVVNTRGGKASNAGRPRLCLRLMIALSPAVGQPHAALLALAATVAGSASMGTDLALSAPGFSR